MTSSELAEDNASLTDLERLLQTTNRRFPLGAFCAGIAPMCPVDKEEDKTGSCVGAFPAKGHPDGHQDNKSADVVCPSSTCNDKTNLLSVTSCSTSVSHSSPSIADVSLSGNRLSALSDTGANGKPMTIDESAKDPDLGEGHGQSSISVATTRTLGIMATGRHANQLSAFGDSPTTSCQRQHHILLKNGVDPQNFPPCPPLRSDVEDIQVGMTSRGSDQSQVQSPKSSQLRVSIGSDINFPWQGSSKEAVLTQPSPSHEEKQTEPSISSQLLIKGNLYTGKGEIKTAERRRRGTALNTRTLANDNGRFPCKDSSLKNESDPKNIENQTSLFPSRPQMETLTESGVVPHRPLPMSNSSYLPKQDSPGRYYLSGGQNCSPGYPGYPQRGGSLVGNRRGEEDEVRDRSFNNQRFPSRDEVNRDAAGMSSEYGSMPSQAPSRMSPFQQRQASTHMPRCPQPVSNEDAKETRGENASSSEISLENRSKIETSISPNKRSGLPRDQNRPEYAVSPKTNSYDDSKYRASGYHKRGDRPESYHGEERRPGANYGRPSLSEMRQSVKAIYDPYDHDRHGSGDKPEAVPFAYDSSNSEAGPSNRLHQQAAREKLERSTSHDGPSINPALFWDCLPPPFNPNDNSDAAHRSRAMTMDSPLQNRRETSSFSPHANLRFQPNNPQFLSDVMLRRMGRNARYLESDYEAFYKTAAAQMNEYQRSAGGGGGGDVRSQRQEMLNKMMMVSPEHLSRDALSPFPQQASAEHYRRLKDLHCGLNPSKSPTGINYNNVGDSPEEPMMPRETQPRTSIPKDRSPFGGNAASTPHNIQNSSGIASGGLSNQGKTPSTPQMLHQTNSNASGTSPKLPPTAGTPKFEPSEENSSGEKASPKTTQQESFLGSNEAHSEERKYGANNTRGDMLNVAQPYPPYMTSRDEQHFLQPNQTFSAERMNNGPIESSSARLMPKKEIMSDDAEEDSFQERCPSPTPTSPTSASVGYPAFPPRPFYQPRMGAPNQVHSFIPTRDPQDPNTTFPFVKNFSSSFSLPGMNPEMPMPPRLGPGPSFMGVMPDEKDVYFCHLCSYSGKSKPDFDNHMGIHFEYNCPHCDYTSRTEGRLKRHIKDFHTDESGRRSMPGRPKVFKCKQCSFSATEKDKFWEHAKSHIKEDKLLQCPKCPFVTEYKHHLEYHLRNHFGSKPFKCNKCNYSCVNKSMLNSHMKSHTNVYQYRCSDCTYATKYCHSLKLHLRKYNHKPATVLNQDGSLPHGLDVDSSGLSVVAKRGPPRGPRGPRKDKNDPYFGQMYGMPPVPMGMPPNVNPMLKGVMPPFWPMMPQPGMPGHPQGHPGMIPGLPGLSQHMAYSFGEENDGHDRSGMENSSGDMNESLSDESNPINDDEERGTLPCRLCDFIGDSTESLCLHLLQVHREKTSDMAKMYGISESVLAENMEKAKMKKERRMSESALEPSDQVPDPSEFHRRNTIAGLLSRGNYPGPPEAGNNEGNRNMPSWASAYPSDSRNRDQGQDSLYVDDRDEENFSRAASTGGMDILQQMTLKFGDGAMGEKRNRAENSEMNINEQEEKLATGGSVSVRKRSHKETPLDLTKPKSVSPPMFSNPSSPKKEDDEDSRLPWMDEGKQGDLTSITEKLYRKRQLSEVENAPTSSIGNSSTPEVSTIVPRKRSRKGKAYKLDTLCLKLQERQSRSPIDSDDTESDLDMNFERFQPLQETSFQPDEEKMDTVSDAKEDTTSDAKEDTTSDAKEDTKSDAKDNSTSDAKDNTTIDVRDDTTSEAKDMIASPSANEDEQDSEMTENKEDQIDKKTQEEEEENSKQDSDENQFKLETSAKENIESTINENTDEGEAITDNCDVMENKPETESTKETVQTIKEDGVEDEAENEFKTLQQTLRILNNEMEEENKEMDNGHENKFDADEDVNEDIDDDDDDDKTVENGDFDPRSPSLDILDKQSSMELVPMDNKDVFDLSDKENSNDGLYLKNESPKSPGHVHIEEKVDMINTVLENRKKTLAPAVRRGTELAWKLLNDPVNPVTSIPIPTQSPPLGPKPHLLSPSASGSSTVPGLGPSNGPSPIRNGFKMTGASPQPVMPLKQPLPIPLPPTPMAFIPPTNRMLPEPPMLRLPPAPPKPMPKDMYECTYCDLSFRDCVMYTVHMGYHSNRNPFKCNSCGIICRDKVEFFLHIARSAHA